MRNWIKMCEAIDPSELNFNEFGKYEDEITQHVAKVIDNFETKGYKLVTGRNRAILIDPNKRHVIKVPINGMGIRDNEYEYDMFKKYKSGREIIPVATCKIFYADKTVGIPLLMMDYVKVINGYTLKDAPNWVSWIDCAQVGYDRKGNLVAYDL
jgi:hypothetical protein